VPMCERGRVSPAVSRESPAIYTQDTPKTEKALVTFQDGERIGERTDRVLGPGCQG